MKSYNHCVLIGIRPLTKLSSMYQTYTLNCKRLLPWVCIWKFGWHKLFLFTLQHWIPKYQWKKKWSPCPHVCPYFTQIIIDASSIFIKMFWLCYPWSLSYPSGWYNLVLIGLLPSPKILLMHQTESLKNCTLFPPWAVATLWSDTSLSSILFIVNSRNY